ncbi:probable DNA-dependent ATPase MGS1 [Cephalotrichum gorgonifer]|uniref:Probable DNA-dependent ATPase MGS1 n=1 Tax=Cephalotrichum gorgonifer TaxID=2041049 RepID=A0AAE8SXR6_9PEZI|nr:probable DNA-dependent ATPase MGS1 [Cephalotrichum gorgonifer]
MPVDCPACNKQVKSTDINKHLDSDCKDFIVDETSSSQTNGGPASQKPSSQAGSGNGSGIANGSQAPSSQKRPAPTASFFQTPAKRMAAASARQTPSTNGTGAEKSAAVAVAGQKRSFDDGPGDGAVEETEGGVSKLSISPGSRAVAKRSKTNRAAPLAERVRPHSLDDVFGQELVGPNGVLRSLIETDRVPSMILWGASGTGKTTIARCIARVVGSRFVEIHATNSGVNDVKKLFQDAANELALTGRKTIIFCDEIHRFNKAQQDVFLKPVEAGTIVLIGATTENPSFKVQGALLSRCRTFTLEKLTTGHVIGIMKRAMKTEEEEGGGPPPPPLVDDEMLVYLAAFSDGDARTALNLLEMALTLSGQPGMTKEGVKASLTKTLVYDRAGDQHYDSISAFHKSVRGNDADAALYYLARMLQSGEDPLFVARRLVVIASEDVGLADNTMLPLATATYTATQQIGMPEARIPLAHCTVALCQAPKSTRAYRGLNNAMSALKEPGVAALPVPLHLRNAPTRLMQDLGYGGEYKYPPNYKDGKVKQQYLPDGLVGRAFLEDRDLGTVVDPDLEE